MKIEFKNKFKLASKSFSTVNVKEPLQVQAVANERIELFIDGVKQTGAELIGGKRIQLKKQDKNLVFELDGEPFAQVDNFYDTQGVSLDGLGWNFSETQFLKLDDTGLIALPDDPGQLEVAALPIIAASGGGGLGAVLGGLGVAAAAGAGGAGQGQAISDQSVALSKIEAYNNGNGTTPAALTVADYVAAGITGVTTDNLAAVNAQVLKQGAGGADTAAEVQSLVLAVASALAKIAAYAQDNGVDLITNPAPVLADYTNAGVTGIGGTGQPTVAMLSSALADTDITGALANTAAKVQTIVDAYQAIVQSADGVANNDADKPTQAQYAAIGVNGVDTAQEISLLGDVLDTTSRNGVATDASSVNTVAKLQALADAVQNVMDGDASLAELQSLGITGVTTQNLAAVQAALVAANDATQLNTLVGAQSIVTTAIASYDTSAAKIAAYAQDDGLAAALGVWAAEANP